MGARGDEGSHARALETLVRDVRAYQFDMRKTAASMRALGEETNEYAREEERLLAEQTAAQRSIVALNLQLGQEQRLNAVRDECEGVAAHVSTLPSTAALRRQIEEAQEGLARSREQVSEAEGRLRKRLRVLGEADALLEELRVALPRAEDPTRAEESDEEGRDGDEAVDADKAAEGEEGEEEPSAEEAEEAMQKS